MNSTYSTLPLGEKIAQIRKAKGLSLENVADAIGKSAAFLSRLERGMTECSSEELAAIKKCLGIEGAPLLEHELSLYRNRIIVCRDLSIAERYGESEAMLKEMSVIMELPFEHSLFVMYLMLEASFVLSAGFKKANQDSKLKEDAPLAAEEMLVKAEPVLGSVSDEALYMYHCVKGRVCYIKQDDKNALKHYLLARNTNCEFANEFDLLANIGAAYYFAGKLCKSLIYLELAKTSYKGSIADLRWMFLNYTVGVCYLCLGDYGKAKDLLDKNLEQARSIVNGEQVIAETLIRLGMACQGTNNYEESIRYFDQAFEYKAGHRHIACLSYKADSFRHMKELDKCQEVLEQGRALADGDKMGTLYLDTIGSLMTLDNGDSVNYLENTAIPFFRASTAADRYYAIYLCNELEAYYKRKRTKTKAWAIAATARDIYKDMYEGDIEF